MIDSMRSVKMYSVPSDGTQFSLRFETDSCRSPSMNWGSETESEKCKTSDYNPMHYPIQKLPSYAGAWVPMPSSP